MHVLLIHPSPPAGAACGVADYTQAMCAALGHDFASLHQVRLAETGARRNHLLRVMRLRSGAHRAATKLPKCDLVHVHYADMAWNGTRMFEDAYEVFTRYLSAPAVVTLHEHPWFRGSRGAEQPETAADYVFGLLVAGRITGQGSIEREVLSRHVGIHVHHRWHKRVLGNTGLPEAKIFVLPHLVYRCRADPGAAQRFREKWQIGNKRLLSIVGFVFDRKRYELAIEALAKLPADTVLCAIGGPLGSESRQYLERLKEVAMKAGIGRRFIITGYLDKDAFDSALRASDVFLLPYGEVSASGSLARCVGAGAPIVAQDCDSFREIRDEGAGIELLDTSDTTAFASRINRILNEPGLANRMREANWGYAERFSLEAVARAFRQWYERLISQLSS